MHPMLLKTGAVFVALLASFVVYALSERGLPGCTADVVRVTALLHESSREISRADYHSQQELCSAYRKHVEALRAAAPVLPACGPPQMTRRSAWPIADV